MANVVTPPARKRGYYTADEFLELAIWKTRGRPERFLVENRPEVIEEATQIAFSCHTEELRIGVLRSLRGVSWPVASAIFHFGHRDRYPILDFRALEALGLPQGSFRYNFEIWWAYVTECRRLADRYGVTMRTLDKALWMWRPRS